MCYNELLCNPFNVKGGSANGLSRRRTIFMNMKRIFSLLLALVLTLALCVSVMADERRTTYEDFRPRALRDGETLLRGIDVSQFQGDIDWKAVAESGVQFAIVRVAARGWGSSGNMLVDTSFRENLTEAHNNGLLVGAYIYSQAITPDEAREEAQFLASLVRDYQIDLPLVFDQEFANDINGNYVGRLYNAQLPRQEMTDLCTAFCAETERLGYESMVYANPYTLNYHLCPDQISRLWLAHFCTETSYTGNYEFWQCSSTGKVPGIAYNVDLDFWFANIAAPLFTDVSADHWAYRDLCTAVEKGWIKGCPDGRFLPADSVTRAQFVTMLARLSGDALPEVDERPFPDVPTDQYYAASVAWAVRNGIINGYPDGTFGLDDSITREQMAHIMTVYLAHLDMDTTSFDAAVDDEISDLDQISGWALNDVRFCYAAGLLYGRENGFDPLGIATRAEAGVVLARLDRVVESFLNADRSGVVLSVPQIHIEG